MAKKKASLNSAKSGNEKSIQAFKISMTVVYNGKSMTTDGLADDVFHSMTKVGHGLALLHVDSVKKVSKPTLAVAKILSDVSTQSSDSMSVKTSKDGTKFIAIDEQ